MLVTEEMYMKPIRNNFMKTKSVNYSQLSLISDLPRQFYLKITKKIDDFVEVIIKLIINLFIKEHLKNEKLTGALEMAGAVCHELNQPMMVVSGYVELILMNMSKDDPTYDKMIKIKDQIDRMSNITSKLMKIARYETREYVDGIQIIDIEKSCVVDVDKKGLSIK
jgi:signal transduction histidine kinase